MKHSKPLNASSWIESIAFEDGVLEIKCQNGRVLQYRSGGPELPMNEEVYERFLMADSPGKFYNSHVKKVFPGGAVEAPSETTERTRNSVASIARGFALSASKGPIHAKSR